MCQDRRDVRNLFWIKGKEIRNAAHFFKLLQKMPMCRAHYAARVAERFAAAC
jgi:hypothetical protein